MSAESPRVRLWQDPDFRRGLNDVLPLLPGVAAWGLVTGMAMAKSGIGLGLSFLISLTVYAGSSQLATLPLLSSGAPLWLIWLTAFLVNVRFVIYSAQWRWYFGDRPRWQRALIGYFAADTNYVQFIRAWPDPRPAPGQLPYYVGSVCALWWAWQVPSWSGIVLADSISPAWGLGFAGTLSLVGLTCALLVDRVSWVCAAVAALAAVAAFSLPYKLHIVVAVAAAIAAGLLMENWGGRGPLLRTNGERS